MPSSLPTMKELYVADSLEKLKAKAKFKIPARLKFQEFVSLLMKFNGKATVAKLQGDQELQFFYLHRFYLVFDHIKNLDEFREKVKVDNKIKNQVNDNIVEYERVVNRLIERYKEKQSKLSPPVTPVSEKSLTPKNESVENTKNNKKSIECKDLFKILKGPSRSTCLILDCRPQNDFEYCHINDACVINVPEDKMKKGFSAVKVGSILSPAAQGLWANRTMVDVLVLHDWASTEKTLDPNSPIYHLRDSILKWDPNNSYKSPPLILEGGFEMFFTTFPHNITNVRAEIRPPNNQPQLIMPDSFDYPISILDQEQVEVHKPTSQSNNKKHITVDRSTKPKVEVRAAASTPSPPETPDASTISQSVSEVATMETDEERATPPPPHSPQVNKTKEIPHAGEPHDSEDASPPEISSKPSIIDNVTLKHLRKLKPAPEPKVHGSPLKNVSKEIDNDSFSTPLKKDGGAGILKRASSSPNIAQIKDDAPFKERPVVNRETKPSSTREFLYSERIDATYGTTTNGLTGLKNFANNCYMNSIIQCLSNTEALVKDLIHLNKPAFNRNSKTKGRVAQEVINTLRCMWSGDIRVNSIKPLKSLMGEIKDMFKGAAQQDSNEFLMILLEHLHDDLNIPCESTVIDGADIDSGEKSWGEFKRKNCSVIQRLFYGQQKSTVTCSTCHHQSVTFEPFFNLFVPLPNSNATVTLNDCIQLYISGERISGWKCPKCDAERNATKKFDISRLPPILIIALKRFTQENDSWLHKKENTVVYPLDDLDMEQFTVKGSEQRYSKYNLYAMSTHFGTLGSGHYRAICKNYLTQKWYMFDDQSVDLLPPSSVKNNSEVYILFYSAVK